jgi:hypothetical protein
MKFLLNLSKKPATFQRIIGLNINQASILTLKLQSHWESSENKRLNRSTRRRKIGGGRPYKAHTTFEKLVITLMYYKTNMTQELIGIILGMDQSAVSRLIAKILPLIEQAADPELRTFLAKAKEDIQARRISSLAELVALYPDLKDVSTDATEGSVYRATKYEVQKEFYSGKSKMHALKTQITVSSTGRFLDVSASYPGSFHDKTIMDKERTVEKFAKIVPHRFDSGYQGVKDDYTGYYLILPVKKPRKRELPALYKEHNKCNSKRRVVAEHGFSKIKKYRAFANVFRQPIKKYNQAFSAVVAVLNFRLQNSVVTA